MIDALIKAMGDRIAHCTARENLPAIREYGLQPAEALAKRAGRSPREVLLRGDRLRLDTPAGPVRFNHQKPILNGMAAAHRALDGHTPHSWAAVLDARVFFWPASRGQKFTRSVARDLPVATLWLDTRRFLDLLLPEVDLSPINSGNFLQGGAHAKRGDWLFVAVSEGLETFRENRRNRGLVATRDSIAEISLRRGIPPEMLRQMIDQGDLTGA